MQEQFKALDSKYDMLVPTGFHGSAQRHKRGGLRHSPVSFLTNSCSLEYAKDKAQQFAHCGSGALEDEGDKQWKSGKIEN